MRWGGGSYFGAVFALTSLGLRDCTCYLDCRWIQCKKFERRRSVLAMSMSILNMALLPLILMVAEPVRPDGVLGSPGLFTFLTASCYILSAAFMRPRGSLAQFLCAFAHVICGREPSHRALLQPHPAKFIFISYPPGGSP